MGHYKVTTAPAAEPVTLEEVKGQLGISSNDDSSDPVLESRITGARQWVEHYCERALISQTVQFRFDSFPTVIKVPLHDIISVTSITYIDSNGDEQTVDAATYTVDTYDNVIRLAHGYSWPVPRIEANACRVVYVAGYGTEATDVPANIKDSIINIIGHWTNYAAHMQNGLHLTQVPAAIKKVLDLYRTRFI